MKKLPMSERASDEDRFERHKQYLDITEEEPNDDDGPSTPITIGNLPPAGQQARGDTLLKDDDD